MVGNIEEKHKLGNVRNAENLGEKRFNQEMGNKLAREIGAVKYIECSWQSGRGCKILIDEIVTAYLEKRKTDAIKKRKSNQPKKRKKRQKDLDILTKYVFHII